MPQSVSLQILESFKSEINDLIAHDDCFPLEKLDLLASEVIDAFKADRKLAFLGNGGSAAEAMHLAAEFTGHCVIDHMPLPAICLNESQSAITAIGNDYGQEFIFSRLVEALIKEGDIIILLSTSGKSGNILRALESAKRKGAQIHLWTGNSSPNHENVNLWKVPSTSTPRIQEVHLMWGHMLATLVESKFSIS
jgi:D-sedoheptulose 7-phosphate isomerase